MATAHATPAMLAAFACGTLAEGMSLLVASHLTLCPTCQSRVAAHEAICGALLRTGDDEAPSAACLDGVLARLAEDEPVPPARVVSAPSATPTPILAHIGGDIEDLRWRFLLPGLSEHRLDGFEGEDVRLLRAKPGVRILSHTHTGDEATLILSGRMRDGDRTFERGDVSVADDTDEHRPEIVGSDTCVCLIVLSGRMRFTGSVGRVLNLFN